MRRLFYPKLAADNMKKNKIIYLPYIVTCIFTVAIYYIMTSLSFNQGIQKMSGAETVAVTLGLGCSVIAIFSIIFFFYTNSFVMKRRKKEFGLFHILGMEKKHISKVIALETLYTAGISIALGLLFGIALDKAMYLLLMKIMGYDIVLGFYVSVDAIIRTVILYSTVFGVIFLSSVFQIYRAKTIELLQSKNVGEREPKTKLMMTILGIACLGSGYAISVVSENPIAAIFLFFIAVILVIMGTYFLFIAGSIAFLKMLKKNKKYYYQIKHFTSVSGLIYRMKQNAAGLSNICILSTMVLVMLSATSSMMIGIEEIINTRYPYDLTVYSKEEAGSVRERELEGNLLEAVKDAGISITEEIKYTYLYFTGLQQGDTYVMDRAVDSMESMNMTMNLFFINLSDYNRVSGENKTLEEGQILIYSNRDRHAYDTLKIGERTYEIAEQLKEFVGNGILAANVASTQFIVVKDIEEIEYLDALQRQVYGDKRNEMKTCYGLNLSGGSEGQIAAYNRVYEMVRENGYSMSIECKAAEKGGLLSLYGGFFFIGIFLGLLFVIATVLIIYYKQISEGYEDKERFEIMQKVGMSLKEIKQSIHSQIITVFFLPLITAGIHVAFAFPIIARILAVLNLTNTKLFIICTLCCFLLFTLLYAAIYAITAKAYYRIVSQRECMS